jgi:hypothetical protein
MKYPLIFAAIWAAACGAAQLSTQDKTDLAQYQAEQAACIVANPENQAAMDSCRAAVQAAWHARWNARFDGGF